MSSYVIDYTSKDYESIRQMLLDNLSIYLPEYTNRNSNDFGIFLMEQVAVVGDILSFYQDRVANEMFFETAQLRESVTDLAAYLGYYPASAKAAQASIYVTINPQGVLSTIPVGTKFGANSTDGKVTFETLEEVQIPAGEIHPSQTTLASDVSSGATQITVNDSSDYEVGDEVILDDGTNVEGKTIEVKNGGVLTLGESLDHGYLSASTVVSRGVPVVHGVTQSNEELGTSNASANQRYALAGFPLTVWGTTKELIVQVNEGGGYENWTEVDWFLDSSSSDKHYRVIFSEDTVYILFGDGTRGKIPANIGAVNIRATYKRGGGAGGNVPVGEISIDDSGISYMKSIRNLQAAQGGENAESIANIKESARTKWKTRDRAVTLVDYKDLCQRYAGVEEAAAIFQPPDTVDLYVRPIGGGDPSTTLKNAINDYFIEVGSIGVNTRVYAPSYVAIDVTVNITVTYGYSGPTVVTNVENALTSYFSDLKFDDNVPLSDVYAVVDAVAGVETSNVVKLTRQGISEAVNILISQSEIGIEGAVLVQEV